MKPTTPIFFIGSLLLAFVAASPTPQVDVPSIITDINSISTDLLTLHRAINSYGGRPENNADILHYESQLEQDILAATEHVELLGNLSTQDSKTLTDAALATKNPIKRYLQDVVDKKSTFDQAEFDESMRENLKRFQEKANGLGRVLQRKVQQRDAQTVQEYVEEIHQSFVEALGRFA